jgi:beta-lactamase class C
MIDPQAQHTQGGCPMKDDAIRPAFRASRVQASHRWRTHRLGALALLLPLALGSTAQTSLRWQPSQPATRLATVVTPSMPVAPVSPHQIAYAPPPAQAMPVADSFDVRRFEAMAQAMVADGRVPGLAMAIVKDGRIVSARGNGVTDVDRPEQVDAHTVFRLASLS